MTPVTRTAGSPSLLGVLVGEEVKCALLRGASGRTLQRESRVVSTNQQVSLLVRTTRAGGMMSLIRGRYRDAYALSRTTNSTGQLLKSVGGVIALIGCAAGAITGAKLGGLLGGAVLLVALGAASQVYALGIVIAAQGQLLMASVDTAVNTSQLLTREEVRDILTGLDGSVSDAQAPSDTSASGETWRCLCGQLNPYSLGRCSHCRAWRASTPAK